MPLSTQAHGTILKRYLAAHPVITFLMMGITFLLMGLISLNLVYLFHANLEFIVDYGLTGLRDGGLRQLLELVVSGYVGMALYVLFKACEKVVVERVLERKQMAAKSNETGGDINAQ